jgi:hypothetical protein
MNAFRRRLQPTSLWLALALFVGQILAVAHATQHELAAQGSQPACEICIVAHGAGALPPTPHTSDLPQGGDQPVIAAPPARIARLAVERPRSRGPPVLI